MSVRLVLLSIGAFVGAARCLLLMFGGQSEQAFQRQVSASYAAQTQIATLFSLVQDAETGQRGYVITGADSFLTPYLAARERVPAQIDLLRALLSGRTDQLRRLEALDLQIQPKLRELAETIAVKRAGRDAEVAARIAQGSGDRQMQIIRRAVGGLIAAETASLSRQRQDYGRNRRRLDLAMLGLLAGLAGIAGLALRDRLAHRRTQAGKLARAEQAAERLAAIYDGAVDAVITLSAEGVVESVNRAGLRMFAYDEADLLGRDLGELLTVPAGNALGLLEEVAVDAELDQGWMRQISARRSDGATFAAELTLRMMQLPDGRHLVAVLRDISERRRMEVAKDEFVATVSHELRTPLTSIAGSLGLLKMGAAGVLPAPAMRLVEIAESNSERLVRLINDILDIEKIGAEEIDLDRTALDLNLLARSAVEGMTGLAEDRRVTLKLTPASAPAVVLGDSDRLMQVLANLLSNAIKFSPSSAQVEVTVDCGPKTCRISVADHGPGVPEAFRSKIFHKFTQADNADSRAHGGTGLGLAIARRIVTRHDGEISFSSPAEGGAVFHVDLPRAHEVVEIQDDGETRVLVCEDEFLTSDAIRAELEQHGYAVDTVATANDARNALLTKRFAALVLDINLPDANGLALVRSLRNAPRTRDLPIVVTSGMPRDQAEVTALGLIDWLEKPIAFHRLTAAITSVTGAPVRTQSILHVDDDPDLTEVSRGLLGAAGEVAVARTLKTARAALATRRPDLVILDLRLPDGSGLELLPDLTDQAGRPIPVILYCVQEPVGVVLPEQVEAVLIKSRASLQDLARTARRIINRTEGATGA